MEGAMFQLKRFQPKTSQLQKLTSSSLLTAAGRVLLVASMALVMWGCESDSPTAPSQTPAPPATSGGGSSTSSGFKITVTSSPEAFELGEITETGNSTAQITVVARRNDNNAFVPENSTALLTTTAGTLTNLSGTSGVSIPISFDSLGRAIATLQVPTTEALTLRVRAQIESSFGDALVQITEDEQVPFFIQSVSPSTGPPTGGTVVDIRGTGFDDPIRVNFGALPGVVQSTSSTRIVAMTPSVDLAAGATLPVAVSVQINVNDPIDAPATDSLANAFTYARGGQIETPTVVSVTPTSGPNEGGTQVTILGEGFANDVQVFFGTGALIEAAVLNITPTSLLVRTPSATGPNSVNQNSIVDVRVVNRVSGASNTLTGAFQYGGPGTPVMFISAAGPSEGIYLGGTNVTIFGQGFAEPIAVAFGGLAQQPISVTGTEIVARSVPVEIANCSRPSGAFSVVNIETGEQAGSAVSFTYRPVEPAINGISPSSVTVDVDNRTIIGSDTFTIDGGPVGVFDNRDILPRVVFGDVAAPDVTVGDIDSANFDARFGIGRTISGTVAPFTGSFATETCDAGGVDGERFLPTVVSVTVTNQTTDCSVTATNFFTYEPSDPTCRATADSSTAPVASFTFSNDDNNLTVDFMDTSTGTPTSWLWDFDDNGATSSEQNPTYSFPPGGGTFNVMLTVTNANGSDSTSQMVPVTPLN